MGINIRNKNIFKQFFQIGMGTIIGILLGLVTTPIITRIFSPNEYGQYTLFNTYTHIAVMILCLGLDQALVRFYYVSNEINYKRALIKKTIKIPVYLSIVLIVALFVFYFVSDYRLNLSSFLMFFLIMKVTVGILYRFSSLVLRL